MQEGDCQLVVHRTVGQTRDSSFFFQLVPSLSVKFPSGQFRYTSLSCRLFLLFYFLFSAPENSELHEIYLPSRNLLIVFRSFLLTKAEVKERAGEKLRQETVG